MHRWFTPKRRLLAGKIAIASLAAGFLGTCSAAPDLLTQIKKLGQLRVVTRNSPNAFFSGPNDEPQGPEYELVRRFAADLDVKLIITPMRNFDDIYSAVWLGHADLAAAALSIPTRPIHDLTFGPAYQRLREHLIYRRGSAKPRSLAEIGSGHLEVAAGSSRARYLQEQRLFFPTLTWVENGNTESLDLLERVASGEIDYTIADSNEFARAHDAHPELAIACDFAGEQSLAWAFSTRDVSLLRAAQQYFAQVAARGDLAMVMKRYYGRSASLQFVGARGFMRHFQSRLPRIRSLFEEAATVVGEDWRLLAAIAYQESKWDPGAASVNGAEGIMQLTQQSATQSSVSDRTDPRQNIFGGARYFRLVHDQIPDHVPEPDRTWFALASYNVGYGHLEDARILTQKAGRDADSWQDVRDYLPLLEQERWYTQAQNGYARGWEPVRYVDNVRGYRDLLEWLMPLTSVPTAAHVSGT